MDISICIVTFKERASDIKRLISQIRLDNNSDGVDILLAINGNNNELMEDQYRRDMLQLCQDTPNCYPIFCPEFKSLPKLWNTLAIFSRTEYNFFLCDDVEYTSKDVLANIQQYIKNTGDSFFKLNNGFSYFVVTKTMLHQLRYFDERLIAYGEEDGDIIHQFIKTTGTEMNNVYMDGLYNKASYDDESNQNDIDCHIFNKPRFNREFALIKYQDDPNGINGMNPTPLSVRPDMEVAQQYPYEEFVRKNKHNITKFDKVVME